jgi:hypothetical protein
MTAAAMLLLLVQLGVCQPINFVSPDSKEFTVLVCMMGETEEPAPAPRTPNQPRRGQG